MGIGLSKEIFKCVMGKRKDGCFSGETPNKKQRHDLEEESDDETTDAGGVNHFHSKNGLSYVSNVGEFGIIESISLRNFMCHSLLGPFKFGPNVNFIVGNNGSGKSAVLTALIVGLGGKATITNRGSSIKGFVKDGQSWELNFSWLSIWTPSSLVSDTISRGHIVSSKKEELISVLDHFNIQVDNPVTILTQEMSKHFLQSKSEADKYKFFMKATQLEQMKEDLNYIMETYSVTTATVTQQEECLVELKRKVKEKEERYKSISSLEDMKKKLDELKNVMAWALVNELDKQIQPLRDQLKAESLRTVKYDQRVEECQARVKEAEEKYKTIQEELVKITEEANRLHPECTTLKADVQVKSKARNEAEGSYCRFRSEFKRLEKDRAQLKKKIEELKNSANQISEAERLERLERIAKLQDDFKTLKDQEVTTCQQLDQFQQAIYKYKDEQNRLRKEENDVRRSVDTLNRQMRDLIGSKTNKLKRFGQFIPDLLDAIEEAHRQGRFRRKPLGPLGACIRLKDPELALAVESCLKGLLLAFCCDNYKDEKVLQSLMSKFCKTSRPQIIVSEFTNSVYDVRARAVNHPHFPSVLTALEVDDPVVANCLIDMRGIESVLLIKNKKVARQVMQQQQPPKNCREAFTGEGDQVFSNRFYSSEFSRAKYLSGDVDTEISLLEKEIENKNAHLATFQHRLQSIGDDIKQNEDFCRRHHQKRKQLQDRLRKMQLELNELENVEEPQSVDISALEEEAQDIMNKMHTVENDVEVARKTLEERKSLLAEAEQKYRDIKEKINSIAEEADPIKEKLSKVVTDVDKSKHDKKHYEDKRKEHVKSIKTMETELASKDKELEEKISLAKQIYPERLQVNKSARSLDLEINRLREKISTEQHRHGNREEIIREYKDAVETYTKTSSHMKNLKKFIKLLESTIGGRQKAYKLLRRYLTLRCKIFFDSLLSQRGCSGKMNFDHVAETLTISVQPGEGDKAALSDMRSLSGGERSFSTVCFILALWGISDSPFRCLDEFDVYMDMVNRRISMDMMLRVAESQRYRQFILLTPQSMSSLPASPIIRILRMRDPERGQTTLPFGNSNEADDEDES
ncbi:structural maintenance of chromosomes protein 6 [Protopterus annectens]|uniref:structural maintenance of chromosomes protein 6 n=1 Tax=Protopterus annectens TaxID=7888 RepID=UPI001CF977E1|nr:structural maintenance of chromosomes protein 6 [Protopterus annectens]